VETAKSRKLNSKARDLAASCQSGVIDFPKNEQKVYYCDIEKHYSVKKTGGIARIEE